MFEYILASTQNIHQTSRRLVMAFQPKQLDFSGHDIYVGIDVHKSSWVVSIMTREMEHKTFTQPPSVGVLLQYLRRNFPGARYHCAYEAGYSGFWIYTQLCAESVECLVVHPADVPTADKEKRQKDNHRDARKLARHLRAGELHSVYVPSTQALYDRSLVRTRHALVDKQTRCKNQIKAFLSFHNIHLSDELITAHWSRLYIQQLQALTLAHDTGTQALRVLLSELVALRESIAALTKEIRRLAQSSQYRENVTHLVSLPGISVLSAMIIMTELVTLARFRSLDALVSYFGLIPSEHSTGDERTLGNITERKNPFLRRLIIESAWVAVRHDPVLLATFATLCQRMTKNHAIVRIARKLISRIRFVLRTNSDYVTPLAMAPLTVCKA
jgi:transposase